MRDDRHTLRFVPTMEGFESAAAALRALLDQRGIDGMARYNTELAFEEIALNIIRHGSPRGEVTTTVVFGPEIVMTFDDDGLPFDPTAAPDPVLPSSIEEAKVGGLGLLLVKQFSSRMTYRRTPEARNQLTLAIPAS